MRKSTRKALAAAIRQMKRSTHRTAAALDIALSLIDASNARIAKLEAAAKRKRK